jgi:choline dehydrogenase-like flavoprotein
MKQMRLKLDGRRYGFFWHHMGTTRMDGDPSRGVVDLNCRVHGMSNLFIAGSSVFPTGGCAPPTLAIVALALRIADEIVGSRVCVD